MASSQEKALRAEAEARQAASDRAWTEPEPEDRPGVIGSVIKAVQSAKEVVVGKSRDQHVDSCAGDGGGLTEETTELAVGARDEKEREAAERVRRSKERTGEMMEKAKEAAGEMKNYMAQKENEAVDRTKQMAESTREKAKEMGQSAADKTKEKAQEAKETAESSREKTKDMGQSAASRTKETTQEAKEQTRETSQSVADMTKETTHSAASKLGQLKGKAMGFLSGKKEEAKEQTHEIAQTAKEKLQDTEEEARQRMEELRLKGKDEYEGDISRTVREDKDESERRGGGILGAVGALKERLTQRPSDSQREPKTEEEKRVAAKDVSSRPVESALKASDQASGQTFNDVGRIEG